MRQSDVSLRNVVEQYKSKVNRRSSQMPETRRAETVSELISIGNPLTNPLVTSKASQMNEKIVGNPNTHKNAKNRRNNSTFFDAQRQEEDNKKTHKILQMYKKMKSS